MINTTTTNEIIYVTQPPIPLPLRTRAINKPVINVRMKTAILSGESNSIYIFVVFSDFNYR